MTRQVFTNGRIYTATGHFQDETAQFENAMIVDGTTISYVGGQKDQTVCKAIEEGASVTDLDNKLVVPGLMDAHTHLMYFGIYMLKVDIAHCKNLQEIRDAVAKHAKAHPELPRLMYRGWHQHTTNHMALASDLDDLDPRPIYIESENMHSTWCNTAAINELPFERLGEADSPTCVPRDEQGKPTGLIAEVAHLLVAWHHQIAALTMEEKLEALDSVFKLYIDNGYTGATDLAMDELQWEALQAFKKQRGLPIHVAAHWLVTNGCSREELTKRLDRAIELHKEFHPSKDPEFCIQGIKIVLDGMIDGCTAACSDPFPGHKSPVPPTWTLEEATFAIKRVNDAGMQVAMHAVGDVAIRLGIDAIEAAGAQHKRHRMEHVEFPTSDDIRRIGELGIIASIQPALSDPFAVRTYEQMVGSRLWERAFPNRQLVDGNAVIAIGTDAPSADHRPLPTLFNATTRRSAKKRDMLEQTHAHQALALSQAMYGFTAGGAYARHAEDWTGSLSPGKRADFVVLDLLWDAEALLQGKTLQTWSRGVKVFQA